MVFTGGGDGGAALLAQDLGKCVTVPARAHMVSVIICTTQ